MWHRKQALRPRLHEIAAGLLVAAHEEAGYAAQGRRHGFDFVLGEVTRLDPEHRRIEIGPTSYPADDPVAHATGDDLLSSRTLDYDTAVLAIGSTVNDSGVPGVRERWYTLTVQSRRNGCTTPFWRAPRA